MALYEPWIKSKSVPYGIYSGNKTTKPTDADLVCAHRTLPFGTMLKLSRNGKSAYCMVLDRGPYGFCQKVKNELHKERRCPAGHRFIITVEPKGEGHYRAVLDATPAVHKMMGSSGWVNATISKSLRRGAVEHVPRLNAFAEN